MNATNQETQVNLVVESHDSPLGPLLIGASAEGLVRVGLPAEDPDAVLDELVSREPGGVPSGARDSVTSARRQLDEYFAGRRHRFEVALDWRLAGEFHRDVLRATAQIPYGRTASYRDVATRAGSPAAVRAAGSALARNPLPVGCPATACCAPTVASAATSEARRPRPSF